MFSKQALNFAYFKSCGSCFPFLKNMGGEGSVESLVLLQLFIMELGDQHLGRGDFHLERSLRVTVLHRDLCVSTADLS